MIETMKAVNGHNGSGGAVGVQSVADILERELDHLIKDWLARVDKQADLTCIPLNYLAARGGTPFS
jgi:hypothetical protein